MKKLSLSCAASRFRNGEQRYNPPSRFLDEIPGYLIKQSNLRDLQSKKPPVMPQSKKAAATGRPLFAGNPMINKGFASYQASASKAGIIC